MHRSKSIDGFTYHLLSGFASGDIWVRRGPGGEMFARDMNSSSEQKIAHFGFGVRAYRTELSGMQDAQPAIAMPKPSERLSVTYAPGPCRDVGLSEEIYAPGMGLMRRTVITIRGPVTDRRNVHVPQDGGCPARGIAAQGGPSGSWQAQQEPGD